MKRKEFIKLLEKNGCYLKRHGGNHDVYENFNTNKLSSVPRHNELQNTMCKVILKQLEIGNSKFKTK